MIMCEKDQNFHWGYDLFRDPFASTGYYGPPNGYNDGNYCDLHYGRDASHPDETHLHSSALTYDLYNPSVGIYHPGNVGEHEHEHEAVYIEQSSSSSYPDSDDCFAMEEEVGKRFYPMVPVPHLPKINGEIPSMDEATMDHERLTERLRLYELVEHKVKGDGNCQISKRVFSVMRSEFLDASKSDRAVKEGNASSLGVGEDAEILNPEIPDTSSSSMPFELYKTQTTILVLREKFLNVVCDALSSYKYVGPNQKADLLLACRIKERKESVTVLLCGTSGCGKSTLSSLLGSRLGITTVVSTDSIRHMMRSFADEKQNPLLYASTYHAGEYLDPVAVAQSKAKRQAKKLATVSHPNTNTNEGKDDTSDVKSHHGSSELPPRTELIGNKQMAIEGFKAQSEMVIDSLDRLITSWEEQKESVIVEGVHLSLNFVMGLMKKHPSIIPFMVYIANEEKHMERFAVRAKYMTLDPAKNRYIKYIRNIRAIQEYLCNRADKHLVPKINNTNVDQSVAAIHATVFSCLRRREAGELLYDLNTNTVSVVDEEYRNQRAANSMGSKGMFQFIQRKGSSRNLMALLNPDGSVTKAWHVDTSDGNGNLNGCTSSEKSDGNPMVNPSQIGKAEPVNLQFGSFGISALLNDTGGTSHTGSVDDLRADGIETGSRYFSSCCSSPKMSDCASKEHMEDYSVYGSEEEADDPPDAETDEDLTDEERDVHEIEAGSVDEHSTKSDEEYDDLAMQDVTGNDNCSDDEQAATGTGSSSDLEESILGTADGDDAMEGRCHHSLDLFLKMSKEVAATEMPCA